MHCESNENFRRKSARLLKRRIAIFSAAIMAAICVLVAVAVFKEREAALEQARTEAASLSASFEQQISGTLDALTGAMELLKDRMEAGGGGVRSRRLESEDPQSSKSRRANRPG